MITRFRYLQKRSGQIRLAVELALLILFALYGYWNRGQILAEKIIGYKGDKWLLCGVWALCLLGILLPRWRWGKSSMAVGFLYCALSSVSSYLAMEMVTAAYKPGQSVLTNLFGKGWQDPRKALFGLFLVLITEICVGFMVNSFCIGSWLVSFLYVFLAIVSYYVNEFRGSALIAADLYTAGTGLEVMGNYSIRITGRVLLAFLILFLLFVLGGFLEEVWITKKKKAFFPQLLLAGLVLVFTFKTFVASDYIAQHFISRINYFNVQRSYRVHGMFLGFCRTIPDILVHKPEGYSADLARQIAARYPSDSVLPEGEPSPTRPNIIIIVNESFADLHTLGKFKTSQDEMPFLHSLEENCIKGYAYSSVFGGRTANTEYEILTGHTMGFLSSGTVPFQIYIRSQHPSLASYLTQAGYGECIAYHPSTATNYRRNITYPLLGFQDYYSIETMPIPAQMLRNFVSDQCDYENVQEILRRERENKKKPYFFYNMTIQNHTPYYRKFEDFTPYIFASLKHEYYDVNQYLSLVNQSDQALEGFLEKIEESGEPTLVLFVGDHQPSLQRDFYKEVKQKKRNSFEKKYRKYKVPFWIWANFDIKDEDQVQTSMNYMQLYLQKAYSGPMTGYQKFLMDLQEKVPVINSLGYLGADGNYYQIGEKDSPYYEAVHEYAILQYNCLFDPDNRVEDFYSLS